MKIKLILEYKYSIYIKYNKLNLIFYDFVYNNISGVPLILISSKEISETRESLKQYQI